VEPFNRTRQNAARRAVKENRVAHNKTADPDGTVAVFRETFSDIGRLYRRTLSEQTTELCASSICRRSPRSGHLRDRAGSVDRVTLAASLVPAARATRIDPVETPRHQ